MKLAARRAVRNVMPFAAVVVLAGGAAPARAALPVAGKYGGTTSQRDSQGHPGTIAFRVASGSRQTLRGFTIRFGAKCDSGKSLSNTMHTTIHVSRGGVIRGANSWWSDLGSGFRGQNKGNIRARFISAKVFAGTFDDLIVVFNAAGKRIDTCHTGTVKFTARRGAPAARAAAVPSGTWTGKLDKYTSKLHFAVKGSRLVKFTVPEAPAYCQGGFQSITVYVPAAPISAGRFARTYTVTRQGVTQTIKLSGSFSGRRAKGSVKLSGPCIGTFTWTARPRSG